MQSKICNRFLQILLGLFLFFFFLPAKAEASFAATSIRELTKGAPVIVTGTVIKKEVQWGVNHEIIYTYVTVLLNQLIKNSTSKEIAAGDKFTIRLVGGTIGDLGLHVSTEAKFELNEKVFLFLNLDIGIYPRLIEGDRAGDFIVYGSALGKFTITDNGVHVIDGKENVYGKINLDDFIKDIETIMYGTTEDPLFYLDPENLIQ